VPLLAILTCGYLMAAQPRVTWVRFVLWLGAGLLIYLGAGVDESKILGPETRRTAVREAGHNSTRLLLAGLALMLLSVPVVWVLVVDGFAGRVSSLWVATSVMVVVTLIAYVGLILWVRGCGCYAVAKGYSRWLGLVGVLGPVGLGIVALLPARHTAKDE
jgi:hypothetical protein